MELFDKALYDYIRKDRCPSSVLNLKLKVLGENEASAKPWIVVLCEKELSKRVRKFFQEDWVKKECRSQEQGQLGPSLQVVVSELAPRALGKSYRVRLQTSLELAKMGASTVEVYGEADSGLATLGGLVKVEMPNGYFCIYGMTAGHVVDKHTLGLIRTGRVQENNSYNLYKSSEDKEESAATHTNEETPVTAESPTTVAIGRTTTATGNDTELVNITNDAKSELDHDSTEIRDEDDDDDEAFFELDLDDDVFRENHAPHTQEHIETTALDAVESLELGQTLEVSHELDWALIALDDTNRIPPICYRLGRPFEGHVLLEFPSAAVVYNSKAQRLCGTLSTTSYSMLPFSKSLVEVFDLVLNPNGEFTSSHIK
jgi:hypothetical protein